MLLPLIFLLSFFSSASFLFGDVSPSKKVFLTDYFPNSFFKLYIDPAIPKNYKAVLDIKNYSSFAFWVPQEAINHYTNQMNYNGMPVIVLNPFNGFRQEMLSCDFFKKMYGEGKLKLENLQVTDFKWGNYPGIKVSGVDKNGLEIHECFVGMNASQGPVMQFNLFGYQGIGDRASKAFLEFWDHFITNTKPISNLSQLADENLLVVGNKIFGNVFTQRCEVTVESRKSDGKLDVQLSNFPKTRDFTVIAIEKDEKVENSSSDAIPVRIWCSWEVEVDKYMTEKHFSIPMKAKIVEEFSTQEKASEKKVS